MPTEHVDVLIVGAGLSGIGAACHLRRDCPDKSLLILEARANMGGTWDLFRYPGIRSDSDMFTLGYAFKPWTEPKAIADGESILSYIRETATEYGITEKIRYQHRVVRADWSSETARWTVTVQREDSNETVTVTCSFLSVCSGYYRYDQGHTPTFVGAENFAGTIVHPQHWSGDLDYAGKRVVVIGSGATAMTLVPSLAKSAAHVTMLQRTPTYVASLPARDPIADALRRRLPSRIAYQLIRLKNVLFTLGSYQLSRRRPALIKRYLHKTAVKRLPEGYDVAKHFGPDYDPWDQRICLVPDGDLFRTIREGKAEVVTDHIDRFTETGIDLKSGQHLDADIIVTATGLSVLMLGGMTVTVDGREIALSKSLMYKGMMLSGVPNFSMTIGYTNASWTLKADLVARYLCRLLNYMDKHGYQTITPVAPAQSEDTITPLFDLKSGYVLRNLHLLPQQGAKTPWRLYQNYLRDVRLMRRGSLTDDVRFGYAQPVLRPHDAALPSIRAEVS